MLPSPFKPLARRVLDRFAVYGSRRYVAGASSQDALEAARTSPGGIERFIICPWNRPEDSPTEVFQSYTDALEALRDFTGDCFLSIKLPSLNYDTGMITELIERASVRSTRIHLDALTADSVERTIKILHILRAHFSNLGSTVPGRWRRSLNDLPKLLDLELPLRIVKGQLPDREGGEIDPSLGFLRLIEAIQCSSKPIGVASHDRSLVERSIAHLSRHAIPCEVEQLFGLALIPRSTAPETPRRLYIPYGHGYPPYDIYGALRDPQRALRLSYDVIAGFLGRRSNGALTQRI
ncbi:MAG: hypothetical protein RL417_579 [Pseudomonadota bacterium]|jgi:proline dehydrogenase